jgi:23S rRNA (adenine2503-C2)-methyltransferase
MSGNTLPDIRSVSIGDILSFMEQHHQPAYRARQLYEWLWKKQAGDFNTMSSLPAGLRNLLKEHFTFYQAIIRHTQRSQDGTVKVVFDLHDGSVIEGVLIPSADRLTVCISSQVGCALACRFCATGTLGFERNLLPGEIVDQVSGIMNSAGGQPIPSNIVFMGMGEPFLNYENVVMAIDRLTSQDGWGMSPQRITISSIGMPKMIRKMGDDRLKCHFALSLHAANEERRHQIMPFSTRYTLQELSDALLHYHACTGNRFTIEYIMLDSLNDSRADANDLARFCRRFPVKINLLEYNEVSGLGFRKSSTERIRQFAAWLEEKNMVVNIRMSRGRDIDAACGQLAGKMRNTGSSNG